MAVFINYQLDRRNANANSNNSNNQPPGGGVPPPVPVRLSIGSAHHQDHYQRSGGGATRVLYVPPQQQQQQPHPPGSTPPTVHVHRHSAAQRVAHFVVRTDRSTDESEPLLSRYENEAARSFGARNQEEDDDGCSVGLRTPPPLVSFASNPMQASNNDHSMAPQSAMERMADIARQRRQRSTAADHRGDGEGDKQSEEQGCGLTRGLRVLYSRGMLRNMGPLLLLAVYSVFGAWAFLALEQDHERQLLIREAESLDRLRNLTLNMLYGTIAKTHKSEQAMHYYSNSILQWYEKEFARVSLPPTLPWDMWSALYFVGTLFTTIGYGNIFPRTWAGRALACVYATIGIPLVLAILSRFGKALTHCLSRQWVRYRLWRRAARRAKRLNRSNNAAANDNDESKATDLEAQSQDLVTEDPDLDDDSDQIESSTIPVWLAFAICGGWICGCAGLFCIWETRWSYFTSLYFFCISTLTVGLGDITPDHPRMLLIMFWLVILGLSIVSMLLSVIQIKIEEWLFNMLVRMKKEYRRALEAGEPDEGGNLLEKTLNGENWFVRNVAPLLASDTKHEELQKTAEKYEQQIREANNKWAQTDLKEMDCVSVQATQAVDECGLQTSCVELVDEIGCDDDDDDDGALIKSPTTDMQCMVNSVPALSFDYLSDLTHDETTEVPPSYRRRRVPAETQTDIAQFEIDQILLRLLRLQQMKMRPRCVDRSMETSLLASVLSSGGDHVELQDAPATLLERSVVSEVLTLLGRSMEETIVEKPTKPCQTDLVDCSSTQTQTASFVAVAAPLSVSVSRPSQTAAAEPVACSSASAQTTETASSSWTRRDSSSQCEQASDDNVQCTSVSSQTATLSRRDSSSQCSRTTNREQTTCTRRDKIELGRNGSTQTSAWCRSTSANTLPWGTRCVRPATTQADAPRKQAARTQTNEQEVVDLCVQTDFGICNGHRQNTTAMMGNSCDIMVMVENEPLGDCSSVLMEGDDWGSMATSSSKHDLVVQTDDSYLKIARKLDDIRTSQHGHFLNVCVAVPPGSPASLSRPSSAQPPPQSTSPYPPLINDRPSERREFALEPPSTRTRHSASGAAAAIRRRGFALTGRAPARSRSVNTACRSVQAREESIDDGGSRQGHCCETHALFASSSITCSMDVADGAHSKQRASSRHGGGGGGGTVRGRLERKPSLPTGCLQGKVSEFVARHERGDHQPALAKPKVHVVDLRPKSALASHTCSTADSESVIDMRLLTSDNIETGIRGQTSSTQRVSAAHNT